MAWFNKSLEDIVAKLKAAQELIEQAKNDLDGLGDDAEEKVDNIPDNLQSGEKYDKAVERKDELQSQFSELDSLYDELDDIINDLEALD